MRFAKTLTTGVLTLAALSGLTACGGDDDSASGPMAGLNLPKADTMAELQKLIIDTGGECSELRPRSDSFSALEEEAEKPAWSIKERAVCHDGQGDEIALALVGDMAKMQEAMKKALAKGEPVSALTGENFVVIPEGDNTTRGLMLQGGLLLLTCDPKDKEDVPSGFAVKNTSVKGCFTTDYAPA
ncbi:hypothetical protein JNUCC64_04905 [Streptomyces sp. JNUCC 64]